MPEHWKSSFAEIARAIYESLLKLNDWSDADPGKLLQADRLRKLLYVIDMVMFHKPPKTGGGKTGQGSTTLDRLFNARVKSFWNRDWQQPVMEAENSA